MKKQANKITALMDALKDVDKDKLTLSPRKLATGTWWYVRDRNTKPFKWYSIGTMDEQIARRVFTELTSKVEYGQSEVGTIIQINVAKLDREMRGRTWNDAFESYTSLGQKESSLSSMKSAWNNKEFTPLKTQNLVTTTSSILLNIFKVLNTYNQKFMLHLHNHATRMGWLVDNNLMPKVDIETHRKSCGGNTVAITEEQHLKIIKAMEVDLGNWDSNNCRMRRRCRVMLTEVKTMLELLWELGSSNADTRELATENINWNTGHVIFKRKKWKGNGVKGKRTRQPIRFPMSAKLKEIIRPWYDNAIKDGGGYLLPRIAQEHSSNVLRVFKAYREVAGVPPVIVCEDGQARKIIIHSYRYRMAEHLFEIGATEAEARALMGWQSREVMLAYAKGMNMKIPALDVMAKERGQDKIIPMEKMA